MSVCREEKERSSVVVCRLDKKEEWLWIRKDFDGDENNVWLLRGLDDDEK